jgi:hypothetical protein
MTLQQKDKRALAVLGLAAVGVLVFRLVSGGSAAPAVVGASDSISAAERRLTRVRQLAAALEGKQQLLRQVSAELAQREKGVIQADTAAQAQAQLLNIARHVAQAQQPPIEFGNVELQQPAKLRDYGEVRVAVPFTCPIENLVNFLAELTRQPEAIAATELRISARDEKLKTVTARVVISGVIPLRLVPEKKGLAAF